MSVALFQEIVSILCYTAPLTDVQLLTKLQAKYPADSWTLATVDAYLASGKAKGLFSAVGSYAGGPTTGWQMNKKALSLNYANNIQYFATCSSLYPVPCCSATNASTRDSETW